MRPKKILLVDDNDDYQKLLSKNLTKDGFIIETANNGLQALDVLKEGNFTPDLLLIDLMMPEMSGLELLKKLKDNKSTHKSKFVMLTAKNNIKEITQAFELGASEYLLKTDNLIVMLEKIYEICEIEHTVRANRKNDFISILEVTNVIHDFKVISYDDNTLTLITEQELPLHATIKVNNKKIKTLKNTHYPVACEVQECRIEDDGIKVICTFLDQAA